MPEPVLLTSPPTKIKKKTEAMVRIPKRLNLLSE
jgi:hypothetical protein